jgi:ribosomal protein S18 acetylase RimI-like enzyme
LTCYPKGEKAIFRIVALQIESEASGKISRLYVLPECQRQGIGSALVAHLERKAIAAGLQRLKLHVVEQAHWAVNFYRKLGYDLIEKIEHSQGDVIVMKKTLS